MEDCGHVIHRESMDKWVRDSIVKNEVVVKSCPKCSTPVTRTVRYGNIIKERLKNVLKIREKIYGHENHNQSAMQEDVVNYLTGRGNQNRTFDEFGHWLQNMLYKFKRVRTKKGVRVVRELIKVSMGLKVPLCSMSMISRYCQ